MLRQLLRVRYIERNSEMTHRVSDYAIASLGVPTLSYTRWFLSAPTRTRQLLSKNLENKFFEYRIVYFLKMIVTMKYHRKLSNTLYKKHASF